MANSENDADNLFNEMVKRGSVSTSNWWIEKAAEQKNPRLILGLACSKLLLYDRVDKKLVGLKGLN